MASDPSLQRPGISDGKVLRQIWRPSDGNGDPNTAIYEQTRYKNDGHPTWKLYCGDAPHNPAGRLIEPPKYCYLDDRACYQIFQFSGYNGSQRGRFWRHDFGNKGEVKPHRKHRGRPAYIQDGELATVPGSAKVYRFIGAGNPKDIEVAMEEQKRQMASEMLWAKESPQPARTPPTTGQKRKTSADGLLKGIDTTRPEHPTSPSLTGLASTDNAVNSTPRKRSRANEQAIISTNSVSELKAMIIALQDRAKTTSEALLTLQKHNTNLSRELSSIKFLYKRSSIDLTKERSMNAQLQDAIRSKISSLGYGTNAAKNIEIALWRNQVSVYEDIAKMLYGKQRLAERVLEKNTVAAKVVGKVRKVLGERRGDLDEFDEAGEKLRVEMEQAREEMKRMLGVERWEEFERDTALLDDDEEEEEEEE